jgi:transketolase
MERKDERYDLRDALDSAMLEIIAEKRELAVVMADSTSTSHLNRFTEQYPKHVVNVGIAEQNMVGVSVGLSLGGYTAVTANAAPFLLSRANEQVKNDVCYSMSNVKMIGLNAGITYGSLGSTHHILDDISIVRGLGNIQIFAPADATEAAEILRYACSFEGPAYIRLDKMKFPVFHSPDYRFKVGKTDMVKDGTDALIFSMGTALEEAWNAAAALEEKGISAAVCNVPSIRPLNSEDVLSKAASVRAVVTVEEHSIHGGMGSLISSILMDAGVCRPFSRIGFPEGIFVKAGPRDETRAYYGITADHIAKTVEELIAAGENGREA